MKARSIFLFFTIHLFFLPLLIAQSALPRQADLGMRLRAPQVGQAGAEVSRIQAGGLADQLGLAVGDRIFSINGTLLDNPGAFAEVQQSLKGGQTASFRWQHENQWYEKKAELPPLPLEQFAQAEVQYVPVWSPYGYRVQTLVTRPKNQKGLRPAIILARWLSCNEVELPTSEESYSGTDHFLRDLIEHSGAIVMRVEKPGLGDSEGPVCRDVSFQEELAAHRAAFTALRQMEGVDTNRIVMLGISNGCGYAPLVAEDYPVQGYVVMGGWCKTWYEHMLEIERRRFTLLGDSPAEVSRKMKLTEAFYLEYLIQQERPDDILRRRPEFQEAWPFQPAHQYGIPAVYFQQLQQLNLAGAWSKVTQPTLVLYGEYDWIMSRQDHEMIVDLVNQAAGQEKASFKLLPQTGHNFHRFLNQQQAFDNYWSGRYDPASGQAVLDWLEALWAEN